MSKPTFRVASFSTNFEAYPPMEIIKIFFKSAVCDNISYVNDDQVKFEHMLNEKVCFTNFVQISNLNATHSFLKCADCVIVFVDLEKEKSFENLEIIITYIKNNCRLERKVYILGIYSNVDKIQPELKEESINEFVDSKNIYYDYLELNLESSIDLVKIVEFISQEAIENKSDKLEKNKEVPEDVSRSGCVII